VIIDEISLGLIQGSKIDYTEELIGSQFQVINNPQAVSGCGYVVSYY
jgi:Fe-S cluster assembly iron-binding protein IscA